MSAQGTGYDPAVLALIQERIRGMVADGLIDSQILEALGPTGADAWSTLAQRAAIIEYLMALRSGEHRFIRDLRWMGYQDHYIEELLTWPDDEILDEIEKHGPNKTLTLRDQRGLASGLAELRLATATAEPTAEPLLAGGLTWPMIETQYRELAAKPSSFNRRRQAPDQPSRPELAKALNTSPATLKRACVGAGRGSQWPPKGL